MFPVPSVVDVLRTHNELKQMARTACDEGTLDEFLRGLDGEPSAKVETPRFGEFSPEWLRLTGAGLRESTREADVGILKNHPLLWEC